MAQFIVRDLLKIFNSGVSAVLPANLIKRSVDYNPAQQLLTIAGDNYDLKNKNVYLLGTGKAVQNMAKEIQTILGSKIKYGIVSIPVGSSNYVTRQSNIFYYEGAKNNLPDASAVTTASKIRDMVTELGSDDVLIVLISGGGSALLPLPKPPITLNEKTILIRRLANSSADIKELNVVRKRLSDLKGGQLSIKAQPAKVISLILSDIVGDPLDLIASGPTTENKDNPSDAINIIKKYKLYDDLQESIKTALEEPQNVNQFPKENVHNYIVGSNKLSILAALEEARSLNYLAISLSDAVTGNLKDIVLEYFKITKLFCSLLNSTISLDALKLKLKTSCIPGIDINMVQNIDENSMKSKDLCLILGGEITVEVKGTGKGGRNQELALAFSNLIGHAKAQFQNFDIVFLSAGTDGIDGPTSAAGAIGYLDLILEATRDNLNVEKYLEENDSYSFYKKFKNGGFHVITGHTNTNVMDLHIIIIRRNK